VLSVVNNKYSMNILIKKPVNFTQCSHNCDSVIESDWYLCFSVHHGQGPRGGCCHTRPWVAVLLWGWPLQWSRCYWQSCVRTGAWVMLECCMVVLRRPKQFSYYFPICYILLPFYRFFHNFNYFTQLLTFMRKHDLYHSSVFACFKFNWVTEGWL